MGATGHSGAKAKAGLVRAIMAHKGVEADARHWAGKISREYRETMIDALERKPGKVGEGGETLDPGPAEAGAPSVEGCGLKSAVPLASMLRWKVRYFTDGAVIGSRTFMDGLFESCRDRLRRVASLTLHSEMRS